MAKQEGKIAKRYARALFKACPPQELDAVNEGLRAFAGLWQATPELREALLDPARGASEKLELLGQACRLLGVDTKILESFLGLLLSNKRLSGVETAANCFSDIVNGFKKILAFEVTSALELSEHERSQIKQSIEGQIPGKLAAFASISWRVDSKLLGGLLVKVGDKLLDGSLAGLLDRMERQLLM